MTICERCYNERPELIPCADDASEHCEPCGNRCEPCLAAYLAEQTAEALRDERYADNDTLRRERFGDL